ncbi:MAG: 50S ribosomal protein L4 [Pseudomonadales bacterium]|nr:50S ribosomal protein L4 [Pseudomonadales bacterium]
MKLTSIIKSTAANSPIKLSTITVNDEVFGVTTNNGLLSQAVRVYLSNKRQGTSKVKTRGEVTGSRRKIWKQKGTGNARHGAKSAPIFVGGGVAHGPTGLENWTLKLSKVMKRKALISALSMQASNIFVSENLVDLNGKTKLAVNLLNGLKISDKKVLIVTGVDNELVRRAFGNIQRVEVIEYSLVNALNIASADALIISKDAVGFLEKRLTSKKIEKVVKKVEKVVKKVAEKTKVETKSKIVSAPKETKSKLLVAKEVKVTKVKKTIVVKPKIVKPKVKVLAKEVKKA